MIVKRYNLNPLNVFGLRQISHCPPHFYTVDFNLSTTEKRIGDWIWENLEGRFFLGDVYVIAKDSKKFSTLQKRAAFEIHSEASYFAIVLHDINKF